MSAAPLFQKIVKESISPFLAERGFSRKATTFRRELGEVMHLVEVQKSRRSSASTVVFTVNLGVASLRLLRRAEKDPVQWAWDACHWRERLGDVAGAGSDVWWSISDEASAAAASSQVTQWLAASGLPALDALSTDAALRDLWLSDRSPGLTEGQRLVSLADLLREIGPASEAARHVALMKERVERNPTALVVSYLRGIGELP